MTQSWLMLAFPNGDQTPPAAFRLAKSGKCWFRTLHTRDQAVACKRELLAAGIRYTCKKVDQPDRGKPIGVRARKAAVALLAP